MSATSAGMNHLHGGEGGGAACVCVCVCVCVYVCVNGLQYFPPLMLIAPAGASIDQYPLKRNSAAPEERGGEV